MKSVTLRYEHDEALSITLAPPSGDAFESAFSHWFNNVDARDYFANYELVRAMSSAPKGEDLAALLKQWPGLPSDAWLYCVAMASGDACKCDLFDPRALLDGSDTSERVIAELQAAGVTRKMLEAWLVEHPRKGPAGEGQLVVAKFAWGFYVCRAAEATEFFSVDALRKAGEHYAVAKRFVQSCTLFPSVPDVLARNRETPNLVVTLGAMIRKAAGEGLSKRVGE